MNKISSKRLQLARTLLGAVKAGSLAWALTAFCVSSALAVPAQVPLTSRSAPPPPPNVMVTIDDSGSMLSDGMPEGPFTMSINIGTSTTPTNFNVTVMGGNPYWIAGFPADPRKGLSYQNGTVTGLTTGATVYQMQYRSPQVNTIWYDPTVRYQPWISTDGVSRMAPAVYNNARWDPVISTATLNLQGTGAPVSTAWCSTANACAIGNQKFDPGLYYILKPNASPLLTASYVQYDLNDNTVKTYPKAVARTDCGDSTVTTCTQAQEQQNFANWFTYYRMRESLTKAAVTETFAGFVGKIRAGWGEINPSNAKLNTSSVIQQTIQPLDSNSVKSILTNVQLYSSYPSTPLRTAMDAVGAYFQSSDPWLTSPGVAGSGLLSCRRSVNVLMTDGYYNDNFSMSNNDNTNGPTYTGLTNNPNSYPAPNGYVAQLPYKDGYSNTLADVAMKYYATDLQPGIPNQIPPVDGDIAYWQHLTQFTVGLGVKGTLDSSSTAAKANTLSKIKAGTLSWPDPALGNAQKIDDLWHAAVNTGGDFYSVSNVSALTAALQDAFGRAAGGESKEAGVAITSNTLVAGDVKLVPWYHSSSWNGGMDAYLLDANGVPTGAIDPSTGLVKPIWSASVPAWGTRASYLFTWDGAKAVPFTPAGVGATNQALIVSHETLAGSTYTSLINYITGDDSNEGVGALYRSRGTPRSSKLLGDFVNSPPVFVKDLVDLNYDGLPDGGYRSYVNAKKARTSSLVFLGGNDGMMHVFDGSNGNELFGYLPKAGLANLPLITKKDYGTPSNYHQFFVDGPVVETDAYIATRRNSVGWANLVLGSMGAGGTGLFALQVDLSNPKLLDGNTLLWEKSSSDNSDIGYVTGQMAAGRLKNGKWKAFVGNGTDSATGVAALLVMDLSTGNIDQEIKVDTAGGNGLMGVRLLQDPNTQEVVGAYAGDLKGNLWRFDFDLSGNGSIGFSGQPLFHAQVAGVLQPQPITMPPLIAYSPAGVGHVIVFGTGKLTSTTDADNADVQSLYGVLDPTPIGASSATTVSPFSGTSNGRSLLVPRTAGTVNVGVAGLANTFYSVSGAAIDWTKQGGWYMDLPFARQRDVYEAIMLQGKYAFFQTIVPAGAAADCSISTGVGVNYLLDMGSGLPSSTPVFDTNGDGVVDSKDVNAGGTGAIADGIDKVICKSNGTDCVDESAHGQLPFKMPCIGLSCPCDPAVSVCNGGGGSVKTDRIWRQIVNPPF